MVVDFNHLNLADVNPDVELLPEGEYEFRVVGAEMKSYTAKNEDGSEEEKSFASFKFAVVNDPEQNGRMVYTSVFPNKMGARGLRNLQDATGITQTSPALKDWLADLVQAQASFIAPVTHGFNKKTQKPQVDVRLVNARPVA